MNIEIWFSCQVWNGTNCLVHNTLFHLELCSISYQTFINIKETVFISGQTVVYASSRLLSVWCCCIAGVCTAFDAPIRPYSWQQYVPLTQCLYKPMVNTGKYLQELQRVIVNEDGSKISSNCPAGLMVFPWCLWSIGQATFRFLFLC